MPKLHVIEGPMKGRSFEIKAETVFVGRSSKNDIQIKDMTLSRKQLKIFRIGRALFVEDLKSTNATRINGRFIEPGESFEVQEGDTLSMGNTTISLREIPPAGALDVSASAPGFPEEERESGGPAAERRSRSLASLDLIYKVTELLRKSLDLDRFLDHVVTCLFETLPRIDRAAIFLFEGENGHMKEVAARAKGDHGNGAVPFSRPILERIAREGKAVRMSNTDYEPPIDFSEDMETLKIRSVLCVPLTSNSRVRGALYVDSLGGPYGFRKEDLLLLNSLSGTVAVAIEKMQLLSGSMR